MPALFTSTVIGPNAVSTSLNAASTASVSLTSALHGERLAACLPRSPRRVSRAPASSLP